MMERTKSNKIRTVFVEYFCYSVRWTYSIFVGKGMELYFVGFRISL